MKRKVYGILSFSFIFLLFIFISLQSSFANGLHLTQKDHRSLGPAILTEDTDKLDLHPVMEVVKDRELSIGSVDILTEAYETQFSPLLTYKQEKGFFFTGNWLRFDLKNTTATEEWILEFAFPLINILDVYMEADGELVPLYETGSDVPYDEREIDHRYFAFPLILAKNEVQTFYAYAVGSGDLHPAMHIWNKEKYDIKAQQEAMLLGVFYGVIIVMIIYNLFLFIGLRMRSYLYYVIMISFTLLGQLSINGVAYQYLWPQFPKWNVISVPIFVSLACIFILLFSWEFLELKRFFRRGKHVFYLLALLHILTMVTLFITRILALYFMVFFSIITFTLVLMIAIISLIRGARQARFYIIGWIIFLTGVTITLLERSVVLPNNAFTEYAGQIALTIEVVLLSLALADKIAIIRKERALIEQEAKRQQQIALENLQKADELKDEFLAITSHELRTPLHGMIGIAESLQDGVAGHIDENVQQQLGFIVTSGKRLTFLVDEILDLSKLKYNELQLDIQPVHLRDMLNMVLAIMQPIVQGKPISIQNNVPNNIPRLLADKNRLQQILYNLIENAFKYTDSGTITIDAAVIENRSAVNSTERKRLIHQPSIQIRITDTGKGISTDMLDIIFKPFQQINAADSRQVGGVGIGLSITHELIELHKGTIKVDSIVGKGTTFTITLPATEEALMEKQATITTHQNSHQQQHPFKMPTKHPANKLEPKEKATILVADDEPINLQVLYNHLTLAGYEVITIAEGVDVFHIIKHQKIDLLILDIMMPGMSGYEISKQLRNEYSLMELPILMLTAKNQLQDKLIAFDAGANDYLVKPCERQELLTRVRTLVRAKKLNEAIEQMNKQLEVKVAERTSELKQAYDEVQAIAASKQQLLANISHELGTPVTTIHQYFQSIFQGIIEVDDPYYKQIVEDKIAMLDRLIDDLHQLSTLEAGEGTFAMKHVNLHEWLQNMNDKFHYIIYEQNRQFIPMHIPVDAAEYVCNIDKIRMDQLFANLVSNAIKHTKNIDGTVEFRCSISANGTVAIEVIDNGHGIPKDDLPFIFERFYKKTHEDQELPSTGLGLPISKEIIRYHGGHIFVRKSDAQGTTFIIELPIELEE